MYKKGLVIPVQKINKFKFEKSNLKVCRDSFFVSKKCWLKYFELVVCVKKILKLTLTLRAKIQDGGS